MPQQRERRGVAAVRRAEDADALAVDVRQLREVLRRRGEVVDLDLAELLR
jgi:hypothetical protein